VKEIITTYCPSSRHDWREWLSQNHNSTQAVWLVYYKKESGTPTVSYSDAVDEALCFGWIDSTKKSLGNDSFMQFFCRRKQISVWSKINKAKVQRLIEEGFFTQAGFESIEVAKQNGYWSILDEVEELVVPKDLEKALKAKKGAKTFFSGLSKSVKKSILQWVVLAKRPETRQKRIAEIADLAAQQLKPKQF